MPFVIITILAGSTLSFWLLLVGRYWVDVFSSVASVLKVISAPVSRVSSSKQKKKKKKRHKPFSKTCWEKGHSFSKSSIKINQPWHADLVTVDKPSPNTGQITIPKVLAPFFPGRLAPKLEVDYCLHAHFSDRIEKQMEEDLEPKKRTRLVIWKLVLENFKSYAGTRVIGPFHKVMLMQPGHIYFYNSLY